MSLLYFLHAALAKPLANACGREREREEDKDRGRNEDRDREKKKGEERYSRTIERKKREKVCV
jgi:hypothetical protein